MRSVDDHYEHHLAPLYAWSVGGVEAAIAASEAWLASLPVPPPPAPVIDLGAGFGATSIPLARRGHSVAAVDTSETLLEELAAHADGLPITTVRADLVAFLGAQPSTTGVVLCVGDTLPHLASHDEVDALLAAAARALAPGGVALLSYRPKRELAAGDRFVLVRSDARRTLTAFLEPIDDAHQIVWDVVHERDGDRTEMRVSGYRKLRLDAAWVAERARAHGLGVDELAPYRGMTVQLLRRRSAARRQSGGRRPVPKRSSPVANA